MSDMDKTSIIANHFLAYLDEKLSPEELRRCIAITERYFYDDLEFFLAHNTRNAISRPGRNGDMPLIASELFRMQDLKPEEIRRASATNSSTVKTEYSVTLIGRKYRSAHDYGQTIREK